MSRRLNQIYEAVEAEPWKTSVEIGKKLGLKQTYLNSICYRGQTTFNNIRREAIIRLAKSKEQSHDG